MMRQRIIYTLITSIVYTRCKYNVDYHHIISILNYFKWTLMDINSVRYIGYVMPSAHGPCFVVKGAPRKSRSEDATFSRTEVSDF